ncbi:MAG: hypothetical protein IT290_03705, partial [Deltaproteobacteria bacterium]|nr:hypothetical protein [Deltaproteobacteria bacterium]
MQRDTRDMTVLQGSRQGESAQEVSLPRANRAQLTLLQPLDADQNGRLSTSEIASSPNPELVAAGIKYFLQRPRGTGAQESALDLLESIARSQSPRFVAEVLMARNGSGETGSAPLAESARITSANVGRIAPPPVLAEIQNIEEREVSPRLLSAVDSSLSQDERTAAQARARLQGHRASRQLRGLADAPSQGSMGMSSEGVSVSNEGQRRAARAAGRTFPTN